MPKLSIPLSKILDEEPCPPALERLYKSLGPGPKPAHLTLDHTKYVTTNDLLWCVDLVDIPDHDRKMIYVKFALACADTVAHLTDDPLAAKCREAARAWVANPTEENQLRAQNVADEFWRATSVPRVAIVAARVAAEVAAGVAEAVGAAGAARAAGVVAGAAREAAPLLNTKQILIDILRDYENDIHNKQSFN